MKPTFLLDGSGYVVSAIVSKSEAFGLTVGMGIQLTRDVDLGEHGTIPAGAKGWIDYVDPENGEIELLMEGIEPALVAWGNMLILKPFETDDVIGAVKIHKAEPMLAAASPKRWGLSCWARSVSASCCAGVMVWMVWNYFWLEPYYGLTWSPRSEVGLAFTMLLAVICTTLATYIDRAGREMPTD